MADTQARLAARFEAARDFGLDFASACAVRRRALSRHETRARQLGAYFDLLLRLCEKAPRPDLLDRMERTLAEIRRREPREVPHGR